MFKRANQVQRMINRMNELVGVRNDMMLKMLKLNQEIGYIYADTTTLLKPYNEKYPDVEDVIKQEDFETIVMPYVKYSMIMPEPESNPLNESESCHLK
jgi:hypothetical protein